ncbi:MAG: hypothetical protein ABFC28_05005 [Rikenellaceae bacterium]
MKFTRESRVPLILTVLVIILAISSLLLLRAYSTKKADLKSELLRSENLLSEKLATEKELDKIKTDFTELQGKIATTEKLLTEVEFKLNEKEKKINSLAGANNSLLENKKELEELHIIKTNLEKDLAELKRNFENILVQNTELQSDVSSLQAEKHNLSARLEQVISYNTDNFLINALKNQKKEKLTIRAARTKRLNLTFDVSNSLTEKISFKLITPSGATINSDDNEFSSVSRESSEEGSRKVDFTYSPKEKLEKGIYKVEILYKGNNIGNSRIKLK